MSGERARLTTQLEDMRAKAAIAAVSGPGNASRSAADAAEDAAYIVDLETEVARLRRRAAAMERFLRDYGLTWVGDADDVEASDGGIDSQRHRRRQGSDQAAAAASETADAAPTEPAEPPVEVDFGIFFFRLNQLNRLAGAGKAVVVRQADGSHKLEVPGGVPLVVFRDGFFLQRGPFRPFADPRGRDFLLDILEGFFPAEFRASHPSGVIFDVTDRSAVAYRDRDTAAGSESAGAKATQPASAAATGKPKVAGFEHAGGRTTATSSASGGTNATLSLSADEFLSALPGTLLTAAGDMVPVRTEVARLLGLPVAGAAPTGGDAKPVTVVRTAVVERLEKEVAAAGAAGAAGAIGTVASVRVKSEDGTQTLLLKLDADGDTVGTLRAAIDSCRTASKAYEIRSAFPAKILSDNTLTIRQAGLFPSATLFLKAAA
jgi:hypothetical protein